MISTFSYMLADDDTYTITRDGSLYYKVEGKDANGGMVAFSDATDAELHAIAFCDTLREADSARVLAEATSMAAANAAAQAYMAQRLPV